MARHYSTKDFFRQMPNIQLARYFQGQGLFADLDFAAMKEGKPDELFPTIFPVLLRKLAELEKSETGSRISHLDDLRVTFPLSWSHYILLSSRCRSTGEQKLIMSRKIRRGV